MRKSEENELMWEQFITESPWLTQPIPDKFTQEMTNINIDDIENLEHFDSWDGFEIYSNTTTNKLTELYFLKNSELSAYYRFDKQQSGQIQTKMTWNSPNHKGSFLYIFSEYIIPKFKVVESDDMMTSNAFDMWKKMIGGYNQYNYYAKVGNRLKELTSMHDVYDYQEGFGKKDTPNSTFLVSLKPLNTTP